MKLAAAMSTELVRITRRGIKELATSFCFLFIECYLRFPLESFYLMRIFFILHSPLPTVIMKAGETGGVTPFSLSNLLIIRSHFPHKHEM